MSIEDWLKSIKQKLLTIISENIKELNTEIIVSINGNIYRGPIRNFAVIASNYGEPEPYAFCMKAPDSLKASFTIASPFAIAFNSSRLFFNLLSNGLVLAQKVRIHNSNKNYRDNEDKVSDIRTFFPYEYLKSKQFTLTGEEIKNILHMGRPVNTKKVRRVI